MQCWSDRSSRIATYSAVTTQPIALRMDAHPTARISPKGKYIPPGFLLFLGFQVPGRLVRAKEGTTISYPRRLQRRTRAVIGPFFIPFAELKTHGHLLAHKRPPKPSTSHSKLFISHKVVSCHLSTERRVKHTIQKHRGAITTYTCKKRLHLITPSSVVSSTNTHETVPST